VPEQTRLDHNPEQQIVEHADELYAAREDIANVWTSVALLRSKLVGIDSYEIAWRLGRALFFLGQEGRAGETSRELYAQGADAGKQALRAAPDRVEGHFWLGVNLALLAGAEPPLKAALHAVQAKRALQQAVIIDPAYHAAGPLRVLARLRHKLPGLLGGGVVHAREQYERAIALAADNTVTRIYFAELLLELGELKRARAELDLVLQAPFDADWAFEIKRDQRIAGELLARL
jgi:tetratricopeptide (TPR) repeat protein